MTIRSKVRAFVARPENIFLLLASFFGLATVFLMPVLTAPDEGAHFWTSYGMFSNHRQTPQDLLVSAEDSVKAITNGTYFEMLFRNRADLEGDVPQFNYRKNISINATNEDRPTSSLDVLHLPQGLGILIAKLLYPSVGVMVTAGRLANLATYITAVYFIIKYMRFGKLALTFLALFPMMIQQAGSLSYDVLNAIAIFAWIACMINLFTQKTALSIKQLICMFLLAGLLVATKRSNIILLGFLPFLPARLFGDLPILSTVRSFMSRITLTRIQKKVLVFSVAFFSVGLILWFSSAYLQSHGITQMKFMSVLFNTFFRPEVNSQLDPIVTTGLVGNFGWLWYRLPAWLVFIHLGVFILILLGEKSPIISKLFASLSGILFLVSCTTITIGMYFMWTLLPWVAGPTANFIQGIQGRYFTPLLIMMVPVFAYAKRFVTVKIDQKLLYKIAVSMIGFSLCIYVLLTYIFFYTPASGVKDILLR